MPSDNAIDRGELLSGYSFVNNNEKLLIGNWLFDELQKKYSKNEKKYLNYLHEKNLFK